MAAGRSDDRVFVGDGMAHLVGAGGIHAALALLALSGAGMAVWSGLYGQCCSRYAPMATWLVIGVSMAMLALAGHGDGTELLATVLALLYLCGLGLGSALAHRRRPDSLARIGEHYALLLMTGFGGVLALMSGDLLTMWAGLMLCAVAGGAGHSRANGMQVVTALWISAATLLGIGLVYYAVGATDLQLIDAALWRGPGSQSSALAVGLGTVIIGPACLSGLVMPYCGPGGASRVLGTILGVGVLARMYLVGLGAVSWTWRWGMLLLGGTALLWGLARSLRGDRRLERLDAAQRGLIVMSLGLVDMPQGVVALLWLLVAYLVSQGLCAWPWDDTAAVVPGEAGSANLADDASLPLPHLAALCTLAGAPLTVGLVARAQLLWASYRTGSTCAFGAVLVGCLLLSGAYWPEVRAALRAGRRRLCGPLGLWRQGVELLLVLGSLVLSLMPGALDALARAIAGR